MEVNSKTSSLAHMLIWYALRASAWLSAPLASKGKQAMAAV